MHAYSYDQEDDGTLFVFASSAPDAVALLSLDGYEYEVAELTARPAFDRYAPGPVTDAQRHAEGWPVHCRDCEHQIDADGCDECAGDALYADCPAPVVDGSAVYCSAECHRRGTEKAARIKHRKAAALAALSAKAPFVIAGRPFVGGTGPCTSGCFSRDRENVAVPFAVPGGRFKAGDHANSYCHGCGGIWVCAGDQAAWDAATK